MEELLSAIRAAITLEGFVETPKVETGNTMIYNTFKNYNCIWKFALILVLKFQFLQSIDSSLDIKDVCKLSDERYPDKYHSVNDILHTYEVCLLKLDKYSTTTRETLLKQLIDKLECFKEDLKQSYYAGHIAYDDMELVENMEQHLKNKGFRFSLEKVHTNHINCNVARAVRSTVKHIIPLVVTGSLSEKQKACEAIFKQEKVANLTEKDIPTPQLDNNKNPKELIVPLACPTTFKVDSPEAQDALTQYYKVVMKCLTMTTQHKIQVFRFNRRFYDWLTQAVLPHLKDDKCYPAFGGVLRIVETMRQNDFVPKNATANFIFYRQKDLGKEEEEKRRKEDCPAKILHFTYFPLILLPLLLFILIIILFLLWRTGCCETRCWCCNQYGDDADSSSTEVFYYPLEDSRSVSLVLDDVNSQSEVSSNKSRSDKSNARDKRQRGGGSHLYSVYQQESMLMGFPLKRLLSSKGSNKSYTEIPSPGKKLRKGSK